MVYIAICMNSIASCRQCFSKAVEHLSQFSLFFSVSVASTCRHVKEPQGPGNASDNDDNSTGSVGKQ